MKIKNWQHAEQIISSGKEVMIYILQSYSDQESHGMSITTILWQIQWWMKFEERYFNTKFLPITTKIVRDVKQAKEYLWLDTRVEDLILELNK